MAAAAEVYVEQMTRLKLGKPLWNPDSCQVYVGDVGFFESDGDFCRLFNILVRQGDPLNPKGVPMRFHPLQLDSNDVKYSRENCFQNECLKTSTVTACEVEIAPIEGTGLPVNTGLTYKCSNDLGALLLLRNRTRLIKLLSTRKIRNYIRDHIDSWYKFGQDLFDEDQIPEGSLVLVQACIMSDSWALASFAERSQEASVFFKFESEAVTGLPVGPKIKGSWSLRIGPTAHHREGDVLDPATYAERGRLIAESTLWRALGLHPPPEPLEKCIDCLFVQVFGIRRKVKGVRIPTRISAQAGPHHLPSRPPSRESTAPINVEQRLIEEDQSVDIEVVPELNLSQHPLDHLLKYMLSVTPEAELAIATDEDLCRMIPDEDAFDNISAILQDAAPNIRIDSYKTAYIPQVSVSSQGSSIVEGSVSPELEGVLEDDISEHVPEQVSLENLGQQIANASPLTTSLPIIGTLLEEALEQSSQIRTHAMAVRTSKGLVRELAVSSARYVIMLIHTCRANLYQQDEFTRLQESILDMVETLRQIQSYVRRISKQKWIQRVLSKQEILERLSTLKLQLIESFQNVVKVQLFIQTMRPMPQIQKTTFDGPLSDSNTNFGEGSISEQPANIERASLPGWSTSPISVVSETDVWRYGMRRVDSMDNEWDGLWEGRPSQASMPDLGSYQNQDQLVELNLPRLTRLESRTSHNSRNSRMSHISRASRASRASRTSRSSRWSLPSSASRWSRADSIRSVRSRTRLWQPPSKAHLRPVLGHLLPFSAASLGKQAYNNGDIPPNAATKIRTSSLPNLLKILRNGSRARAASV